VFLQVSASTTSVKQNDDTTKAGEGGEESARTTEAAKLSLSTSLHENTSQQLCLDLCRCSGLLQHLISLFLPPLSAVHLS
jgi:hypothetical protein